MRNPTDERELWGRKAPRALVLKGVPLRILHLFLADMIPGYANTSLVYFSGIGYRPDDVRVTLRLEGGAREDHTIPHESAAAWFDRHTPEWRSLIQRWYY